MEKNSRFAGPEVFLRFEADLDFQKSRCRLKGLKKVVVSNLLFHFFEVCRCEKTGRLEMKNPERHDRNKFRTDFNALH